MREAIGGVFSLQIILVFVILINGYMAYSVNYTRAFRVKNGIINIVEEREGFTRDSKATEEIHNYVSKAGYGLSSVQQMAVRNNNNVDGWYCNGQDGYCIKCFDNTGNNSITSDNAEYRGVYYSIRTYVNMDIPVLNKIFTGLPDFLAVKGDTKTIYTENGCQSMNQ